MTREGKRKALFDMKMQQVGIDPNKMEVLESNKKKQEEKRLKELEDKKIRDEIKSQRLR